MPTPEIQSRITPGQILSLLKVGNQRFVEGKTLDRDPRRQVQATAEGQSPLAVVLACMDSRVSTEIIFDLGLGEVFSIRVAGNIASAEALGSMEFGCAVAGAKLLLVLGHKHCGAIMATTDLVAGGQTRPDEFENLGTITEPIAAAVTAETETTSDRSSRNEAFVDRVAELNVRRTMDAIPKGSGTLRGLIDSGDVQLVGGLYDVTTGKVEFLKDEPGQRSK